MKWINCNKKMPKGLGDVLIAYKTIHKTFNICIGGFYHGEIYGHIGLKYVRIESSKIYWKKLPKPPKK